MSFDSQQRRQCDAQAPNPTQPLTLPSNFANVASLLWHAYAALPAPSSAVNWAGFYIRDDKFPVLASPVTSPPIREGRSASGVTISTTYSSSDDQLLLLGPFQGKPACQEIRFGKGVCGTAAATQETVVVPDVLEFPGHIACDAESRSEIVVPILVRGEVGVYPGSDVVSHADALSTADCCYY